MKNLSRTYFLVIVPIFLLAGCNCPKGIDKDSTVINERINQVEISKTEDEGKTQMARQKTESGLEYGVLKEGSGESPEVGQHVTVHYTGWLNDNDEPGKKFDSSVDRGQPFTFIIGVGQVISGWDEGVISMKPGEKRRLYIPSKLGYGAIGAGNIIPPDANLIFDVELIDFK